VARIKQDKDTLPLYGSVTGITLPGDQIHLAHGIALRPGLFDTFSTPMMAFAEPSNGGHTPAPWVAVDEAYHSFQARVELAIEGLAALEGFTPSQAMWLIAALLRLRIEAPVRVTTVANVPLATLKERTDIWPLSFEGAPNQNGLFRTGRIDMTTDDIEWLSDTLPVAARFFHDERFMRALTIFDESVWSSRLEIGTVFIWTAIEILFDCSGEQQKTRAISSALADCVGHDKADRDRAYRIIAELYGKRGRVVHSGRNIEREDFGQSHALARAAFMNVLGRKDLPKPRNIVLQ
jgi:hypothetical protein